MVLKFKARMSSLESTQCAMVMKQKKMQKVSDCSSVRGWRWYTLTMFNKVNMEIVDLI